MTNKELQKKLLELPKELPIIFKIDQEITGNDDYAWMRGEINEVEITDLYTTEELICDRDLMGDLVNDNPENYGLAENATDEEIENYLDKKKETVIAIRVSP